MAGEQEEVQVVDSCFVTPVAETPIEAIRLSPIDLTSAKAGYTPMINFYRRRYFVDDDFFGVTRLKTALGKALVAFYPIAGRFRLGANGRLEIDCNNKGILFLVAHSCLSVDDFCDCKPSPKLRSLFNPHIDDSTGLVFAIQVTYLKCGGVVLGTSMHHAAMDGTAGYHFLQTWAAFCRDGDQAAMNPPCHDRTRLCARDPPVVHPEALSVFPPKIIQSQMLGPMINEVFTLTKDQISTLKHICGGNGVSTFCAVSAHVWQCMCLARQLPPEYTTRFIFVVNIRSRMMPPLPDGYFGNAVITLNVANETRDIATGDLAHIARRITDTINGVNNELIHSAVDYHEVALAEWRNHLAMGSLSPADVRLANWLHMPFYDLDFSWGKPFAILRAEPNCVGSTQVMKSTQGDGSVRLIMCIEVAVLKEFKRLLYAKFSNMLYSKF